MKQLTLTRTATQALSGSTQVVWQSETRNNGFTWTGTDITMPDAGFYVFGTNFALTISTNTYITLIRGGITNSSIYCASPIATASGYNISASFGLYLPQGQLIKIAVSPAAACTLNVAAEGFASPSPQVHIMQVSGAVT